MNIDLTRGRIEKKLLLYFIPIAAGTLFQQLYNAADAVIVGKYVGTVALAAVGGSAAMISNLLIGFFVALSGGCGVVIAQLFGARDENAMHRGTGTAFSFCLISGIALSLLGYILTPAMLRFLGTPEDTLPDSVIYLRVIFLGVTAQLLYNIASGILRAVGNSRSPFIYLFVCCSANIALDILFVGVFGMGVEGAALATVLSQILSAALAGIKLSRSSGEYRLSVRDLCLDRGLLGRMLRIGVPAGLQSAMYSVSNMLIQIAVNTLGTAVVAGWALAIRIDGFYWAVSSAVGIAVMNFAAQNCGAGRMDRVKDGFRISMKAFLALTLLLSLALMTAGRAALPLFTDDPAVIAATSTVIMLAVPFYFTWAIIEIISGTLRGVGDAVVPVIISGLGICALRVVWLAVAFRLFPDLVTLCLTFPVSWIVTDIAFILYWRGEKCQKRLNPIPAK